MLKGKQKRLLRALGTGIDPILQIGKNGITPNTIVQLKEALEARELIKVKVLKTCEYEVKEVVEKVLEEVDAVLVQIIGRNFLLYKRSEKNPKIEL